MAASLVGKGPSAFLRKVDALTAGVNKDIVGKATLTVAGTAMTGPQMAAKMAPAEQLYGQVTAARNTLKSALTAYQSALPGLELFVSQLELALKGFFGAGNPVLQDFGIALKKLKAPSAETKAKAVAKGRQTRTTRGTKGKVARLKVTTAGSPGLALLQPTGEVVPGVLDGPIPPGADSPAEVKAVTPPPPGGSTPAPAAAGSNAAPPQQGGGGTGSSGNGSKQ